MDSEIKEKVEAQKQQINFNSDTPSSKYKPLENEREYILDVGNDVFENTKNESSPFTKRIKKGAWLLIVAAVFSLVVYGMLGGASKSVDTSTDAVSALEAHTSTTLAAGTKLLAEDGNYVGGDLTITHNFAGNETTLYIWDYAAEDGDYVQVLVDGTPLGDPFMIKNEPVSFQIPVVGEVQVIGTRDGGGGITYAVYYDMNHTTYINGMDKGGSNTYTLVRE